MKRKLAIWILVASVLFGSTSCSLLWGRGGTVNVKKPRLHKTWPRKHRWHKKVKVWKYTFQMPERGGVKNVKMKN